MKKKTALQQLIDKLLWVMATQSNKEVIHGINIAIGHAENALETEREQIEESFKQSRKRISILGESEIGMNDYLIEAKFKDAEQYYRDTYQ